MPKFLGAAVAFVFVFVLARTLGPREYGQAAILLSMAAFCAPLSSLGQRFVALRRLPGLVGSRRLGSAWRVAVQGGVITLLGCVLTAGMVAFGLWLLRSGGVGASSALPAIWLAAALVTAQGALDYCTQVVRALGRADLSLYLREVTPRVATLLVLGGLVVATSHYSSIVTVIALLSAFMIIAVVISAVFIGRDLRDRHNKRYRFPHGQLAAGLPFLPNVLFATARENIDTIIVGLFVGPAEVAIYFTLVKFSNLLTLPSTALATSALVEAVRSQALGDSRRALSTIRTLFVQSATIALPSAVALGLAAPFLLNLFGIPTHGTGLLVALVIANGAIQGTFCSMWEVMQCLPISKGFDRVFAATVVTGGAAMVALAMTLGVVGVAVGYLLMNVSWIGYGVLRFCQGSRAAAISANGSSARLRS